MVEVTGSAILRKEFVDGMVKGFAEAQYKFKQAVSISSTNAWKNTYFRENPNVLSNNGTNNGQVARGAPFPEANVSWTEHFVTIKKFAHEAKILWEDILMNDIDVQARTLFRASEKVTKDVDDYIFAQLSESTTSITTTYTSIQNVAVAAGKHWSGSSAAIIDDLMNAKTLIAQSNYDTSNLMCFLHPRDHRSLVRWLSDKGAQFPSISTEVANNGRVGSLVGIQFVVSNSVAASHALVVVPKICATYKEAVSFRTTTIEDPYVKLTIRVTEEGALMVTDPQAICVISNTRGDDT